MLSDPETLRKITETAEAVAAARGEAKSANGSANDTNDNTDHVSSAELPAIPICQLPPRPWAYGRFLLFGSAAVLGAVDGGGKGAIAVAILLATITGKPLLGEHVWRTGPVAIITYEDDQTEWQRRIAAACLHYELDYVTVLRSIKFIYHQKGQLTFARQGERGIEFPDSAGIIKQLLAMQAVLLIVDPFNHAHGLEDGNNNVMIAKVAGEISRIARECSLAGLALHHLRKGANGNPDDLMGATSLRATFRSCRILARMTPDVAEKMKITDPWRYIRIAGSKENYAPPPEKATWFKLVGVPLSNATEQYPDGDDIGVATTWQPRPAFEGMGGSILRAVFAALRGAVHSPNRQAKRIPWAGVPLMEIGGRNEREAGKIIAAWLDSGVLTKDAYIDKENRNKVDCVAVSDPKAAEILAELESVEAVSE